MFRALILFLIAAASVLAQKPTFTAGWSIYVGWTPYHYMAQSGILRKWAISTTSRSRSSVSTTRRRSTRSSRKNIDACTMTNMEALDMPAASGVPTTSIIIGDYSNGNDALLARGGLQMKDLTGKKLLLVEKTVSEYLFDRAMTINGMRDKIKQTR
jgi:NitT/TauT family transport system substrate-binding protein